jgi:hypothetical protein
MLDAADWQQLHNAVALLRAQLIHATLAQQLEGT